MSLLEKDARTRHSHTLLVEPGGPYAMMLLPDEQVVGSEQMADGRISLKLAPRAKVRAKRRTWWLWCALLGVALGYATLELTRQFGIALF